MTENEGLVRFQSDSLTRYRRQARQPGSLPSDTAHALLQDRRGRYWVATARGLVRFDGSTFSRPVDLRGSVCLRLHERPNGQLLLGCANRLLLFDPDRGRVLRELPLTTPAAGYLINLSFASDRQGHDFITHNGSLYRFTDADGLLPVEWPLPDSRPRALCVDRTQTLWIGTDGRGVVRVNQTAPAFEAYGYGPVPKPLPYAELFQRDALGRALHLPTAELPPPLARSDPYMVRYTLDGRGRLWAGGYGMPVYRFDPATRRFGLPAPVGLPPGLPGSPWAQWGGHWAHTVLTADERGDVWGVTNLNALVRYDVAAGRFAAYPLQLPADWIPANENQTKPLSAAAVRGQRVFLASFGSGLAEWQAGEARPRRQFRHDPANPTSLSNDNVLDLRFDPRQPNWLWVTTQGGGLCRLDLTSGRCRRYTAENGGVPDNTVYSVVPGRDGYLWLGTNRGLCQFNPRTFAWLLFTGADGLPGNEFNRFHFFSLPDGRLAMGGVEGYVFFDPRRIRPDTVRPGVVVNELRLNNRPVPPDSLTALTRLDLRHDQNFLTVGFAALYFSAPDKLRYRYQLTDIDRGWVVTDQPTATYTALPPGNYTLRLNASNTSGRWSDRVLELPVAIRPPWWATGWAYLLYAGLSVVSVYALFRNRLNRLRMQQAVALREREAEGLRRLDEAKSRFFTNVTHEFRTPLTLILTPVEQWLAETGNASDRQRLGLVQRNAQRLLHLINQLLDLARLDAGRLPIVETEGDPADLLGRVVESFREAAERKGLTLAFRAENVPADHPVWSYPAWGRFDAAKWETIAQNLVGNAVKFTERGSVTVNLTADRPGPSPAERGGIRADFKAPLSVGEGPGRSAVRFTITDTGPGIAPEHMLRLFDRFYQVDASPTRAHEGTGVGLALVKELVELLGGEIRVESRVGAGTTFTVELPFRPSASSVEHRAETRLVLSEPVPEFVPTATDEPADEEGEKPRLLVVDDNAELAAYLAESLRPQYRVRTAPNGAVALRLALDEMPDLVVSDVMMPEMDGYELARRLKTDPRTAHLAVVLLTAKAAQTARLEGLALGADDYLTKPFSLDELRLRLRNLTERQARLREFFRENFLALPPPEPVAEAETPADPLLRRLYELLDARLDDPALGVDALADALAMSRASLHRKLTTLTGLAPTELVRQHRLRRAVELLRQGLNVSETATRVGFDSPAYFTRRFREAFGQPPTAFLKG